MFVYSKKIIQFVNGIKQIIKEVLLREVGLKVTGNRFFDRRQQYSYPIKVVIYNDENMLGFFNADFYELGFHECLMHANQEQLRNIIRHELAHYITFITYGVLLPHSVEFRSFCQRMGWGEQVQRASISLEITPVDSQEESTVLRRVKKLLALATSSNAHEAEQAMLKSQQLLLQHHMEAPSLDEDETIVLKRIMKQKRKSPKVDAIAQILATFFVSVVYSRAGEYTYLEVLGNSVNVDIADYVAGVLHHDLDTLWDRAQKSSRVQGTVARNSFFTGLARGYCNKVSALKQGSTGDMTQALMVIEKKLVDAKAMVYQRLTTKKSGSLYCAEASLLGEKMGQELNINPAITKSSAGFETLLLRKDP